ncbi:MAG: MTH1187 family thiamine-binding protein, partial [bacterium]|nr:MTH1187 family thiamine-binding protein [bacterium]
MHVIVDFCVIPMGVGVSVSKYVILCEQILEKANLKTILHSYGTNIEGEWDDVFKAIKQCHKEIHKLGAPRISTSIRLGTRV